MKGAFLSSHVNDFGDSSIDPRNQDSDDQDQASKEYAGLHDIGPDDRLHSTQEGVERCEASDQEDSPLEFDASCS